MTVIVKVFLNVWSASLSDQMQQKSSTMLLQFKPPLHRCHWEGRVCRHHLVAHILITNMAWYQDHTKVKVNVITHTVSTVQWCIHAEMDSFNKSRETAGESQTWADTSLTDTQFKWIWCWWTCVCFHTHVHQHHSTHALCVQASQHNCSSFKRFIETFLWCFFCVSSLAHSCSALLRGCWTVWNDCFPLQSFSPPWLTHYLLVLFTAFTVC